MKRIQMTDGVSLSKVTAGMMRIIGDGMSRADLEAFIDKAIENGVTTFDHAAVYGGELHNCEKRFGEVLGDKPSLRDKMEIVTKFGIYFMDDGKGGNTIYYDHTAEAIRSSVEDSLRALRTDYVDVALVHRPSPYADPAVIADTADALIREGKIRSLGVSNFTPAQMRALQKYFNGPLVTNQVQISPLYTDELFNGTLDYAYESKSSLMAWSPMGGGKMFKDPASALSQKLEQLAKKYGVDASTIVYAWIASHPAPIVIVTGTVKWERMPAAIKGCELQLTQQEWFAVLEAARGFNVP